MGVWERRVARPCQDCGGPALRIGWWPRVPAHLISLGFLCVHGGSRRPDVLEAGVCGPQAQHVGGTWHRLPEELSAGRLVQNAQETRTGPGPQPQRALR